MGSARTHARAQVLPTAPGATAPADPAARGVQPGLLASALARPAGGVPQPAAEAAARPQAAPPAEQCCHVVAAYWPYKECKQTCSTEVANGRVRHRLRCTRFLAAAPSISIARTHTAGLHARLGHVEQPGCVLLPQRGLPRGLHAEARSLLCR